MINLTGFRILIVAFAILRHAECYEENDFILSLQRTYEKCHELCVCCLSKWKGIYVLIGLDHVTLEREIFNLLGRAVLKYIHKHVVSMIYPAILMFYSIRA